MAYNASYESGDIAEASVSAIATGIIVVSQLAVIVILLVIWGWAKKRF